VRARLEGMVFNADNALIGRPVWFKPSHEPQRIPALGASSGHSPVVFPTFPSPKHSKVGQFLRKRHIRRPGPPQLWATRKRTLQRGGLTAPPTARWYLPASTCQTDLDREAGTNWETTTGDTRASRSGCPSDGPDGDRTDIRSWVCRSLVRVSTRTGSKLWHLCGEVPRVTLTERWPWFPNLLHYRCWEWDCWCGWGTALDGQRENYLILGWSKDLVGIRRPRRPRD